MLIKRIVGICLIVLGLGLIASSFYIKSRVASGREQIAEAESAVRKGKQLFSINPFTKELGKGITDSVEKKIQAGSTKADRYATIAMWFQIVGGVCIVVGAGLIFFRKRKIE